MDDKNLRTDYIPEIGGIGGKLANILMLAVFLIFTFGFSIALIVNEDREFSEMENRTLAQKPEFSLENLTEGRFTSGIEEYISDQLFLKDALVSLKTDCDRTFFLTYT